MKKALGQYFTISDTLQQFIFDHVKYKGSLLLEPSFGAGHLLQKFKAYDSNYPMLCYELDASIKPILSLNRFQTCIYEDFTKATLRTHYKTIIGNPPYVKQSTGNLYLTFIELCYRALDEHGELLFIVPSDFLKLTSASALIQEMTAHGTFTDFFFPSNERLFEGANIDVVVFRYEKDIKQETCQVNGKTLYWMEKEGILTFSESKRQGTTLETLFHAYVGLVSGRDSVYKVPFGNMEVLCDKDVVETFIYAKTFPTENEQINTHLLAHKEELLGRKIRSFTESNWFEWGAPRNIRTMESQWGKPCIYVRNMTRKKEVAFIGTVQYFGGSLLCLIPQTPCELEGIVRYLNSDTFQKEYIYAGRFKIGHKQLCQAILPSSS